MGDETKLPKWAREELATLRHKLAAAEADRDEIVRGGDPKACDGFWLSAPLGEIGDYPLPINDRRLQYRDHKGEITFRRLSERSGERWLELNGNGGDGLLVRPWVTNVVHIRIS